MALDIVGGATSNEALDARAGATDYARASGGKNSPLTTDKAKAATGKKSKIQESGSVDLSNSKGNKFGADFSGIKGNVTLTNTGVDAEAAFANSTNLANTFSSTVKDLADKQTAALETILSSQSGPVAESGASDTPATTVPETEEEAAARKKKVTILLAIVGVVIGLWFFLKKR